MINDDIEKRAKKLGVPVIQPLQQPVETNPNSSPVVAICGACGLELHRVMNFACPRSNCPVQLKTTC